MGWPFPSGDRRRKAAYYPDPKIIQAKARGQQAAMASIVGFCYWWLYRRLICIPAPPGHPADSAGDHLAIGLLINIEPPGSGDFLANIDNDYSIGILPCPLPQGATRDQVVAQSPYGYLVEEQPGLDPDRFPEDARTAPGILVGLLSRTGRARGQRDPVRFGLAGQ
jgi:hypothetical protein